MPRLSYNETMHRIILPLLAGLLLAQSAGAEIYKCRLPNGKVEISNSPCPGDSGTYPDDDLAAALGPDGRWRFTHKDGRPYGA